MTTWYILSDLDKLCFTCHLPACNQNNPNCPRRQALAAGNVCRRRPTLREIQMLDYLNKHPDIHFRGKDLADTIGAEYQTTLNLLWRLKARDKVSHTGKRNTSRWTAKPSP